MLCIGHRGARGYLPENTLSSIELAICQGADWIEIDVRCHDEELLVIHDERLERTTNGQGYLWQYSIEQLRKLDAGQGQAIPLLGEVIECVNQRLGINIELKDSASVAGVIRLIEAAVARGWHYHQFLVSSFFHRDLQTIKRLNPAIRTGALLAGVPLDYAAFAQRLGAWSVNLCNDSLNPAMVDDAHQRGLKVLVYTVNQPEQFKRLSAMGVDGIFTDFPDRLTGMDCGRQGPVSLSP